MSMPNVMVVIADQMTAKFTSAYGSKVVKTPNLDRLCKEGVRFDSAYTNCPLCAPARASMVSGQYVSRLKTYDNGTLFAADIPTFAHTMNLAGYETVTSGKMHFIGPDQFHGINKRLTTDIYPAGFGWAADWQNEKVNGIKNIKGSVVEEAGECQWSRQLNYDEEVHSKALEYLRTRYADTYNRKQPLKPFCLTVSYTHPHSPFQITKEYMDLYADAEFITPVSKEEALAVGTEMDKWITAYEGVPDEVMNYPQLLKKMQQAYF